ncbi:hypothetical protein QBC46DRAFT_394382 [Diplogelasinospora grovesii]|uniref:Uncharacterized protein n=1 Tax=Diplogelasinospora grovesii TaxID=303347 RepID=A0AAN6S1M7_9PEZI|nr:hypothetical protein QBC46DRAFT_394382 [Diplogelasinospora grovesii]
MASIPEKSAAPPPERSEGPVRILVQTKTHLVPGEDYLSKRMFMANLICQRHWNRDFDSESHNDRGYLYGGVFGQDNRRCYFLVDHGQHSGNDDDVPVLWYEWTGESLNTLPGPLPPAVQTMLREKYPFTPPPIPQGDGLKKKREPPGPDTRRRIIRAKLRSEMKLSNGDLTFMRERPDAVEWLREHIELKFWLKFEKLFNSDNDHDSTR